MIPFPISESSPVAHRGPLSDRADVVVIGGGVVGVTTALFLARRGLRAVLVEKGRIAGEQSSRNWGWIRQQGRDPHELPIMAEANRHWQALARQTNEDIGLVQGGVAFLAETEHDMADFEAWLPYARACGVDSRVLGRGETAALIPGATKSWPGAIHTPSDMRAEPWRAVPALARLAARGRGGGRALRRAAAADRGGPGGRAGHGTGHGARARSGGRGRSLDIAVPARPRRDDPAALGAGDGGVGRGARDGLSRRRHGCRHRLAAQGRRRLFAGRGRLSRAVHRAGCVSRLAEVPDPAAQRSPGTRFKPAAPRGYPDGWGTPRDWRADAVTPFKRIRVLNPAPNQRKVDHLVESFAALFPAAGPVTLKAAWAGMIDTMPDLVPVVDRVAALPGLTLGTGMSGHGFGIGPGVGRVLADLATGGAVGHDLHRFRLARFSDGSPVDLGPAL